VAFFKAVLNDCLKQKSFLFTVLAAGLQEPYQTLRPPIDSISYLRPVIAVLYLVVAAMLATGVNILALKAYFNWNFETSDCKENLLQRGSERIAESTLKAFAAGLKTPNGDVIADVLGKANDDVDLSVRSEGRVLIWTYRLQRDPCKLTSTNG